MHGVAIAITCLVAFPIQIAAIGGPSHDNIAFVVVFPFFPAVVQALAAVMYHWWAVLYLTPTTLAYHLIVGLQPDLAHFLSLMMCVASVPMVISCMQWGGYDFSQCRKLHNWRCLVGLVALSSLLSASCALLVAGALPSPGGVLSFLTLFAASRVLGAALFLLFMIVCFRLLERNIRGGALPEDF